MLKRIVSLVLTLVLVLGTIPWHAKPVEAASNLSPAWPTAKAHRIHGLDTYYNGGHHNGIDILPDGSGAEYIYQDISAVADGVVLEVRKNSCSHENKGQGHNCPDTWGNYICIKHTVGGLTYYSIYAHLKYDSAVVTVGQKVSAGQVIAKMGSSGGSTAHHLHLEIWQGNRKGSDRTENNSSSIEYYLSNPSEIEGVRFHSGLAGYSKYKNWIKQNCVIDGNYYKYENGYAPGTVVPAGCSCSEAYAGWYQVTDPDSLNIRDGHSTSANVLGEMPGGEVVYISKATGTGKGNWGHVTYNGISGYCAMGLLSAYQGEVHADLGTNFYAPIFNKEHWKIIENSNGVVQTATETRSANQLWRFERQSDGSYFIRSCVDGTFLDVYGAYTDMGTTVQTCWETGSPAQRWFIYEDGDGYVLRTALNNYVLDLPNNDPTNGNSLQIWERNGTGAQRWAIYRGEECQLTAPTLSVNVGSSASSTQFTWNDVYGERWYDLDIWKDTLEEGEVYHQKWAAPSGYEVVLPAGIYHAYVYAGHEFGGYRSNVVTFTVAEHQHSYSYTVTNMPTTSAPGTLTGTCSECSETTTVTLPTLNTTDYTYMVTKAATCTASGAGQYTWNTTTYGSFCFDASIAKLGHSYTDKVTAPTCTAQGYTTHICGTCGDSYKDAYTDAKGHSYSYAVEKEPTVTAEGSLKGTCSKCSDTTSVVLPNLNTKDYTYEVVKEPTDTEIGIGKFTWETDAHGKFEFRIELDERKAVLSKIEVVSAPAKTTYEIGESLDTTGLTLKATYSDDSTKTITSGFTCSGFDSSSAGEKTVTVTYNGKSASFTVTVEEVEAVDPNAPRIVVESETVSSGGTVTLEVEIANNPGFSYLKLAAVYDSAVFEFVGATNGTISNEDFEVSGKNMLWSTDADAESDGLLVTLTFKVKENAEEGEYAVGVRLIECFNGDEEEVPLTLTNGMVRITDIIYGDVNGDSKVDGRDMIRLKKYLANYDDETGISTVEIFDGADCNGDNKVNGRDLIRLKKYLANYDDETGSSTVVLGP